MKIILRAPQKTVAITLSADETVFDFFGVGSRKFDFRGPLFWLLFGLKSIVFPKSQ